MYLWIESQEKVLPQMLLAAGFRLTAKILGASRVVPTRALFRDDVRSWAEVSFFMMVLLSKM